MRLYMEMVNRIYGRCRELLRDELGASPSPETEAVFLEVRRRGTP